MFFATLTPEDRIFLRRLAFAVPLLGQGHRAVQHVAQENSSPFGQRVLRKVMDGYTLHQAILNLLQDDPEIQQGYRETVQMIAAVSDNSGMSGARAEEDCKGGIALACLLLPLDRADRIAVLQVIAADLAASSGFRDRCYLLVLARTILEMRGAA